MRNPRSPIRRSLRAVAAAVGASGLLSAPPGAAAQQPADSAAVAARDTAYMDSVFRAHSHTLALRDGRLEGEGARFLVEATARAQFVMIGESHNEAEVPRFTAALFDTLHRAHGFDHFAIEYGPVLGRMLSAPGVRGRDAAGFELARRYPHAFQFWTDEEVAAIAAMGRRSTAAGAPIWGLDNEWGALHVLDRLVELAPDAAARTAARRMADAARAIESSRAQRPDGGVARYISDADSAEFDALRAAFRQPAGSEAAWLIDALELSNRVYVHNGAANRGEPVGHRANREREQYMKAQFMDHYRAAQRAGDSLPRVLLKFGSLHGGKGRSARIGILTLGNFVHEFATSNGSESFHVAAWLVNEPGVHWSLTEEPPYLPLARAGSPTAWTVVDLRPIRELSWAGRLPRLSRDLRDLLFAYDAVLLIGGGLPGTRTRLEAR